MLGLLLLTAGHAAAAIGRQPAPEHVTRVDLGFDLTTPGSTASMAVVLDAPEDVHIGRTVNEVAFPKKVLSFVEGKTTVPDAKLQTEVRDDPQNKDLSIVTVTVSNPDKPLPVGVVASLTFKVADNAKADQPVMLGNTARAYGPGPDPRAIDGVEGRDGEIKLSGAPPVIACFLYMH
jgi:hypothetical protein